jgi:hypothetical protein
LLAASEHSVGYRLPSETRDRRKTWMLGPSPSMTRMVALRILALLFALLAIGPAIAEEQPSAAAMAKAREVVAASMVPGSEEQMIGGISASIGQLILSVNPGHEEQIGPVVDAYFTPLLRQHFAELSDVPAAEFARSFTPAELDQLLAFYRSPLGKKYLAAQAKVQTDMMTQGPTVTRRLLDEAMKKMGPELGRQGLKVPSY